MAQLSVVWPEDNAQKESETVLVSARASETVPDVAEGPQEEDSGTMTLSFPKLNAKMLDDVLAFFQDGTTLQILLLVLVFIQLERLRKDQNALRKLLLND